MRIFKYISVDFSQKKIKYFHSKGDVAEEYRMSRNFRTPVVYEGVFIGKVGEDYN